MYPRDAERPVPHSHAERGNEAQNLTRDALEELRMLTNFNVGNRTVIQALLLALTPVFQPPKAASLATQLKPISILRLPMIWRYALLLTTKSRAAGLIIWKMTQATAVISEVRLSLTESLVARWLAMVRIRLKWIRVA